MPQLVVVEGPNMGRMHQVDGETTIGSGQENTIVLPDRRIAALQARFEAHDGVYFIRNLEHRGELVVNSEIVEYGPLRHGDMLTIGETIMLFNEDGSASVRPDSSEQQAVALEESTIQSRSKLCQDPHTFIESFESLNRSQRRLATLYGVAAAISDIYDQNALLDKILALVFDVFPADRGIILLREDSRNTLVPRVYRNRLSPSGEAPHVSRTILKEVLRTKESVLTMDAMDDDRFLSGMSIVEQNIRSAMCVPLLSRERLLGIIHVDSSSRSRAFATRDLELLTGIAHQAANALENVRIYARRMQHTEDLISLSRATQQLSSYLQKETIHREAVHLACSLVKANRVSLLMLDSASRRARGLIRLVFSRGIDPGEWQEVGHPPAESGLVGHVLVHNRSLLVRRIPQDIPAGVAFEPDQRYATDSFVIVPISAKGDVFDFDTPAFGALCVTDKPDGSRFNERDLQLLSILAGQIGIALTNAEFYERATIDVLTRLYVRRYFFQKLDELVARARARTEPLILLMADLDHFKQCNDTHGHQAGDRVLRETGRLIRRNLRERDIPARYGGEEFGILLYDTGIETAVEIAERLRAAVEAHPFNARRGPQIALSVSIGLAELGPEDSPAELVKQADDALYLAKQQGRNRVVVHQR